MTTASVEASAKANPRLLVGLFFLVPLITSIVPRLTPAAFALVALALIVLGVRQGLRLKALLAPHAALAACLAFSLYVLLSASWAFNPGAGAAKAALLLGLVLVAFAAASATGALDERQLRRAALAFVIGAALGALYLAVELYTKGAVLRFAMNTFPALQPEDTKRMRIVDGVVKRINLSKLNQNATLLALHLWPGLLMLCALVRVRRLLLLAALFLAIFAAAIFWSKSDSSQLALLGSALIFALALKWSRPTVSTIAALWCLGFALIVPFSFAAYHADLHLSQTLPSSYRARLIIWEYTAEQTLERPLLGMGANSTREQDNAGANQAQTKPEGFAFKRTTGHHAHDVFLQTWYELGAFGAILFALAGALVALRIGALPREAQPFAAATFATAAIIAAFAWGIWQTWWMCGLGLAALYVSLAARVVSIPAAAR